MKLNLDEIWKTAKEAAVIHTYVLRCSTAVWFSYRHLLPVSTHTRPSLIYYVLFIPAVCFIVLLNTRFMWPKCFYISHQKKRRVGENTCI